MLRYLRLYFYFVRFSFSRALEFRIDFYFRILMDCTYYLAHIAFFKLIYLHTGLLGGWTESQMMVFVGGFLLLDSLQMTLFSNNFWWLPKFINTGDLDFYLIRPVSSLFFLSLRDFAANSFVNMIMAIGIFAWALHQSAKPIQPEQIGIFLVFLLNGVFIHYLIRLASIIPTFWTHSGRGLEQIFWTFEMLMERPDGIFTGWVRVLLTSILPFCLMASFPTRLFFSPAAWQTMLHIVLVTIGLTVVVFSFWRHGVRAYSSASS